MSLMSAKKLLLGSAALDPDVRAYVARATKRPGAGYLKAYSALVRSLKRSGVWPKLDALYLFANDSEQIAGLNLVQDRFNIQYVRAANAQTDNGPTFNRGYSLRTLREGGSDNNNGTVLSTGLRPFASQGNNSKFLPSDGGAFGVVSSTGWGGQWVMVSDPGNGIWVSCITSDRLAQRFGSGQVADTLAYQASGRAVPTDKLFLYNGGKAGTARLYASGGRNATVSYSTPANVISLLCYGGSAESFSATVDNQVGGFGQSLNLAEVQALETALNTYLSTVTSL